MRKGTSPYRIFKLAVITIAVVVIVRRMGERF